MDPRHEQKRLEAKKSGYPVLPSVRLLVILIAGVGAGLVMVCRYNVSMAMVCMVGDGPTFPSNQTGHFESVTPGDNSTSEKHVVEDAPPDDLREFNWDKTYQGLLLSSYFYGYTAALGPAGWMSDKLPAQLVVMFGVASQGVATLLFPMVARYSTYLLLALRAVQGLTCSMVLPAATVLIRNWSVPEEYSTLFAICWGLCYILSGATFPISSSLCQLGGWPFVFYVTGALPLAWALLAWFLMPTCPEESRICSEAEKSHIVSKRMCRVATFQSLSDADTRPPPTPILAIITNRQILIVIASFFAYHWFYYSINISLPTFLEEAMGFRLAENGLLSGLPTLSMAIGVVFGGRLFQYLLVRCGISRTNARKFISTVSLLIPAALLGAILLLPPSNKYVIVSLIVASNMISVLFVSAGPLSSGPEIAPSYAGIIWGIAGSVGNLTGVVTPTLAAFMTPNKTLTEWRYFFLTSVVLLVVVDVVILLLWRSEVQDFAKTEEDRAREAEQEETSCKA